MASVGIVIRHSLVQPNLYHLQAIRSLSIVNSNFVIFASPMNKRHPVQKPMISCLHTSPSCYIDKQVQENLEKLRKGEYEKNPEILTHFKNYFRKILSNPETVGPGDRPNVPPIGTHALPHPIWSEEELHNVVITHKKPEGLVDKMAYATVKIIRTAFDLVSGYSWRKRSESVWLTRIIFLETVAGVPGMVGAMTRHFHSLRRMRRDHGWIHTLLEEAENERMHLMTALQVKQPGIFFRTAVVISQGIFVNLFFLAYLVSPRFCHRFVGYLEEEAVVTYTKCLKDIESGCIQHWQTQPAPKLAKDYWKLHPEATMRDVILAIRADEAHHRVVNHTLGSMKPDDYNPYKPGE